MKIAEDILAAVCVEHGIDRELVLTSRIRTAPVCAARKDVVERLRAKHFSMGWIAKFMGMTAPAILYLLRRPRGATETPRNIRPS